MQSNLHSGYRDGLYAGIGDSLATAFGISSTHALKASRHRRFEFRAEGLRIPVMTTMRFGAWRPLDPVDDDQGGA
jgi:hypothetical protein